MEAAGPPETPTATMGYDSSARELRLLSGHIAHGTVLMQPQSAHRLLMGQPGVVENPDNVLKRRVLLVAVALAVWITFSSVVQSFCTLALTEIFKAKMERFEDLSQDPHVAGFISSLPTMALANSMNTVFFATVTGLLFTLCGCMAVRSGSAFCAGCFCCCNGCHLCMGFVGLFGMMAVMLWLSAAGAGLQVWLETCDPVKVCQGNGTDKDPDHLVDCLAAGVWEDYQPRFHTRLPHSCPPIFLECHDHVESFGLVEFKGNGCCRWDNAEVIEYGDMSLYECLSICEENPQCLGADVSQPHHGDFECSVFYLKEGGGAGGLNFRMECGTDEPSEKCYVRRATCSDMGEATDKYGDFCVHYHGQDWCGDHDDTDFTASNMCCACGGGLQQEDLDQGSWWGGEDEETDEDDVEEFMGVEGRSRPGWAEDVDEAVGEDAPIRHVSHFALTSADGPTCEELGLRQIPDAQHCTEVAELMGKTFNGWGSIPTRPSGCWLDSRTGHLFFNTHLNGKPASGIDLVCDESSDESAFSKPRTNISETSSTTSSSTTSSTSTSTALTTAFDPSELQERRLRQKRRLRLAWHDFDDDDDGFEPWQHRSHYHESMPDDPITQCKATPAVKVLHMLRQDAPDALADVQFLTALRTASLAPLLVLFFCGCWLGQALLMKLHSGQIRAGLPGTELQNVQQPLILQAQQQEFLPQPQARAPVAVALEQPPMPLRPPEHITSPVQPEVATNQLE